MSHKKRGSEKKILHNAIEIVKEYLAGNKYDGLVNEEQDCSCNKDKLQEKDGGNICDGMTDTCFLATYDSCECPSCHSGKHLIRAV